MSTRSMTVLEDSTTTLRLYRHCDGYPAAAGQALAEALSGAKSGLEGEASNPTKAAARLVSLTYQGHNGARPIYELADWTPDEQGDLDHVYTARRMLDVWTVEHRERVGWSDPTVWRVVVRGLDEWQEFCAGEVAALERTARSSGTARMARAKWCASLALTD